MPSINAQDIVNELTLRNDDTNKKILVFKKWKRLKNTVTYNFIRKKKELKNKNINPEILCSFSSFTPQQKKATQLAIQTIEETIPFHFKYSKHKQSNLLLWNGNSKTQDKQDMGITHFPDNYSFNKKSPIVIQANPIKKYHLYKNHFKNSDQFTCMILHELCHALGMDHPYDHDDTTNYFSIMSYSDIFINGNIVYPSGLQSYDILTLQTFYGQNKETRKGNTYYLWKEKQLNQVNCLWDAGGQDTIDLSHAKVPQVFDMRDGQLSSLGQETKHTPIMSNTSIAFTTKIENYTGSDHGDRIFLNNQNNIVNGGPGNDVVFISDINIQTTIDSKKNKALQKITYGWGHDIYYSQGGLDSFAFSLTHPDQIKFNRKGENMIITYSQNGARSSFTIANFNPKKTTILLWSPSKKTTQKINKKFRKNMALSKRRKLQIKNEKIFSFVENTLTDFDSRISALTKKEINETQGGWVKLAF